MNPVSCITSRMSVNFDPWKEFQRFDPNPHFTFLLAGSRSAARPRVPANAPKVLNTSRRVIMAFIPVATASVPDLFYDAGGYPGQRC